jgi:chloramphenicol O-acetyltransferase
MCVLWKKIKKIKKYTKYSKRDEKYTKFQILASSTVAMLHKKFRSKNLNFFFAESLG